jgi:excisionase family DNA binding protein
MKQLTKPNDLPLLGQTSGSTSGADFLTVADWANRIQVSKRTIFRMIDEGVIPGYDINVGKTRRWHNSTYDRWVSDRLGGN